jgi:hypothetical protein
MIFLVLAQLFCISIEWGANHLELNSVMLAIRLIWLREGETYIPFMLIMYRTFVRHRN